MDEILNLPAGDSSGTLSISRGQLLWCWETRQSALFDLESIPLAIALKNCIEIRYRLDVGIQAILDSISDANQSIQDPWQTPELVKYLGYIELQKMQIPGALAAAAAPHVNVERAEEALDKEQAEKLFWTSHQSTITGPHNYAEQTHPIGSSPQRHQQQQQSTPRLRRSIPSTEKEWTRTEDQKIMDGIQAGLAGQDIYVIRFLGHIPTRTEAQVFRRYNLLKQTVLNNSHMAVPGNQTSQSSMTAQTTLNTGIPLQTFHSIQEAQQELMEAVTALDEENAMPHTQVQVQQQTHLQASMQMMHNQQAAQKVQNSIQYLRPPQHLDQPFQGQGMTNHLQQFQKKTLQQLKQLQPFRARAHAQAQAQAQAQSQASLQQEASQQQGMNMMQSQQAAPRMAAQTRAEQATQNVQASTQRNVQPSESIEEVEAEEEGASEGIKFC